MHILLTCQMLMPNYQQSAEPKPEFIVVAAEEGESNTMQAERESVRNSLKLL